jgi:hypothetical protein
MWSNGESAGLKQSGYIRVVRAALTFELAKKPIPPYRNKYAESVG